MRIEVSDGIKVANQMTLRLGDYPGLSRWTHNHKVLTRQRGRRRPRDGSKETQPKAVSLVDGFVGS